MRLLVGLDVGTSAVKGVLLAEDGRLLARGSRRTELLRPADGLVELDPQEHYGSVCSLLGELAAAVPPGDRVAALAMAAASGNTLLLDGEGRPLAPIIGWLDRRAVGRGAELLPGFDFAGVHARVGWPWLEMFPLAHLAWLRRERPALLERAGRGGGRCCMNSDWLLYRLCGRWGMDPSTATTFYLQDQEGRRWHRPYLERLDLPEAALSPLLPSGRPLGPLTSAAAAETGLSADTLVVLGAFDHPCAARGTGTLAPGDLLLSCGTSWVGFYPFQDRPLALSQGLLVDPFLRGNDASARAGGAGPWGVMFALSANGVIIDWCIEELVLAPEEAARAAPDRRYELFNQAAAAAPAGAGGLFLDTSRGLEAGGADAAGRSSNSQAKPSSPSAAAAGGYAQELRRRCAGHSRQEIARAIMEGAAFEMRRRIEGLAAAGIAARRIAMVGGPAESPLWPRILADVTGLELRLINGRTAGAVGAAVLAGIGAGLFRNEAEAFGAIGGRAQALAPSEAGRRVYGRLYEQYIASSERTT